VINFTWCFTELLAC